MLSAKSSQQHIFPDHSDFYTRTDMHMIHDVLHTLPKVCPLYWITTQTKCTVEIGLLLPSTVLTSAIFCYSKRIIRQKCQHLNFQKSFITACHRPALWKCKTESIPAFGLESGFNNWIKWTVNARSHTHKHKQAAYSLEKHPRPERWLLSCITTDPIAN